MQTRWMGGVELPVMGQGTWQMELDPRDEVLAALRRGLDLGMTHIDTAEMYGSGRVEQIVGEAIQARRDEVYLVSKVMPSNASRTGTIEACERSLRHLGTDRLDLYLLHWPAPHSLRDTIEAFRELVAAGKIRAWGVSNFSVSLLEEVEAIAPGENACNQVEYHLQDRSIEADVLPWCEANDVAVVAYSPYGQGAFPASGVGGGALEEIAAAHDCSRYQVAAAFLTRRPSLLTIPKASKLAHVEDNAAAGALVLSPDEISAIDAGFRTPSPLL